MSKVKELQKAVNEKFTALNAIQLQISDMEIELNAEVKSKIREKFGEAEGKASKEYTEAMKTLELEEGRLAVATAESVIPYPVGTRMVQWERVPYVGGWQTTGAYGILEIFKKGDSYPRNMRWSAPSDGDIIMTL